MFNIPAFIDALQPFLHQVCHTNICHLNCCVFTTCTVQGNLLPSDCQVFFMGVGMFIQFQACSRYFILPPVTLLCVKYTFPLADLDDASTSLDKGLLPVAFQHYQELGTFNKVLDFFKEHLDLSEKEDKYDQLCAVIQDYSCMCFILFFRMLIECFSLVLQE